MARLGRPVPLLELREQTLGGPSRNNPTSIVAQATRLSWEARSQAERFDACLPYLGTPRRHLWRLLGLQREGTCGVTYFAAAAAAAAFLTAFAAADALRRRLVLGGVAGASPMSSAVKILVTKSLGPWSSKSIAVRSGSEAVTIPSPYCSCLMV